MKRFIAVFIIITSLLPFLLIPTAAEADSFDHPSSITVSEDGTKLNITFELPNGANGTYYLFRVTPNNEIIKGSTPIASANADANKASFSLHYDLTDHSSVLYGYILASRSGSSYTALTTARYIDNISDIAQNRRDFPAINSIKGLEVQYITDAQLLGVGHTVLHVKFDELISNASDDSTAFVYGAKKYNIDNEALTYLDYRVTTLTNAGINVYINYILSFDADLDKNLYYSDAKTGASTIYAPNMSDLDSAETFSAVMHFLAERYSMADEKYGFCGNYILGYEANNADKNHKSGIKELSGHARAYATYLRFADLAIRSGYSNAKIFASVSNVWNAKDTDSGVFGARNLLSEVVRLIPDVNFGIALNPYPSDLKNTEYWLDDKAEDSPDTEYLTMKNLSVLAQFLSSDEMLISGTTRSVVISEFGLSGKYGEDSERLQAAAYALAYYTAAKLPFIEAFIWHRHVDHNYEIDLNYGLYSSGELILDGKDKKLIYDVFSAVDSAERESIKTVKSVCDLLPVPSYEEMTAAAPAANRYYYSVKSTSEDVGGELWNNSILFDFSKSLYSFYPSDNSNYLEQVKQGKTSFMRIATVRVTRHEYMGAGISMPDGISLSNSDYISVRVRVLSSSNKANFALVIMGNSGNESVTVKCSSQIRTNGWVTLKFPVSSINKSDLTDVKLKLWAATSNSSEQQVYIDVSSIKLHSARNIAPLVIIVIIVAVAIVCGASFAGYIYLHRRSRNSEK